MARDVFRTKQAEFDSRVEEMPYATSLGRVLIIATRRSGNATA